MFRTNIRQKFGMRHLVPANVARLSRLYGEIPWLTEALKARTIEYPLLKRRCSTPAYCPIPNENQVLWN